jgi:two-component system response regulator PilR (NtrC family)
MNAVPPPDAPRAGGRLRRTPRVLVVDDEADLRELLELTLVGMGLDVDCAADLAAARHLLGAHDYALVLTDMRLPDGDGLTLVGEIDAGHPDTPVAVITAYGSAENAVAALKAGAFDYLAKPVALDALRALVRSAMPSAPTGPRAERAAAGARDDSPADAADSVADSAADAVADAVADAQAPAPAPDSARAARRGAAATPDAEPALIGRSAPIEAVRASIARLARSMAPVAVTGESGTGKELAARLIHRLGSRARQPFVAVNCGAIPESLMEAEFFGYRRGAFTGADQDRAGFFQAAHGGTLFLDEVADLPLAMQVKLLRAIQERRVRRVGATAEEPVDVRIVSATHQDLARCVAAGRFRQDLYYRLNVIELRLPPLRERREDVTLLADALLARLAARAGLLAAPRLSSVALAFLQGYAFPGNVRELENILERALAFAHGDVINVEDLGLRPALAEASEREPAADEGAGPAVAAGGSPPEAAQRPAAAWLSADGVPESLPAYLDAIEREAIGRALERTGHNRTAAARLLGISFRALRYRMQRLGIQ